MIKNLTAGIKLLIVFTFLTGFVYPLIVTLFAQTAFPFKASGSIIHIKERTIGSELIGQKFKSGRYFWSRPSAIDYEPMPSGATNLSQSGSTLKKKYDETKMIFLDKNFLNSTVIVPKEMLFSSASGVDPHISPEAAFIQADRILRLRNLNRDYKTKLNKLIASQIENPQFDFLGKPVINVLILNLELDMMVK